MIYFSGKSSWIQNKKNPTDSIEPVGFVKMRRKFLSKLSALSPSEIIRIIFARKRSHQSD
jgi:hypothetical protein